MSPQARDLGYAALVATVVLALGAAAWQMVIDPYGPLIILAFFGLWVILVFVVAILAAGLNAVLKGR